MDSLSQIRDLVSKEQIVYFDISEFSDPERIYNSCETLIQKAVNIKHQYSVIYKKISKKELKEILIYSKIKYHPYIVIFYGLIRESISGDFTNIVMEFADQGNLREYLKINELTIQEKVRLASETSKGLFYLHNQDIIHNDLHSKNILISGGMAKICDFGYSRFLSEEYETIPGRNFGMPAYVDPKAIIDNSFIRNKKSDIYSFGVILWEILSREIPFKTFTSIEAIAIHVISGNREIDPDGPEDYVYLYKQCWDADPERRPDMKLVHDRLDGLSGLSHARSIEKRNSKELRINAVNSYNIADFSDQEKVIKCHTYGDSKLYGWGDRDIKVVIKTTSRKILFLNEASILHRLNHENIIKFYGIISGTDPAPQYQLILEYADERLSEYLKVNKIEWPEKISLALQISKGIEYIHMKNIIHGKLCPKKLLLRNKQIRITDFSRAICSENIGIGMDVLEIEDTDKSYSNAPHNDVSYTDPKTFSDPDALLDKKSDIYSVGVILWHISSGEKPFKSIRSKEGISIQIYMGERELPVEGTPQLYKDLYTKCWDQEPEKRPDITILKETLESMII